MFEEKRNCLWAIEVKEGVAVIKLKEGEKGYQICNIDKRHHLGTIRYCLYHSNQRRYGLTVLEVDQIVEFAFNEKPLEEAYPEFTPEGRKDIKMANTATFLRIDLEKRGVFRGARIKQHKKAHNYFEKKGEKFVDLGVTSKEAVYALKGWKLPHEPKEQPESEPKEQAKPKAKTKKD